MRQRTWLGVVFLAGIALAGWAESAIYYVDFAGGQDMNPGTSAGAAWQHAPGDAQATGAAQACVLQPGDRVLLKGGVHYRGTITLPASGAAGQPITYQGDAWPGLAGLKAIIDGTDPLTGTWTACASAGEAGGNPHWANIAYLDYTGVISPFTHLFQGDQRLFLAQDPNLSDPFWDDEFSEYYPVPPADISLTSIRDSGVLTQTDPNFFQGAYIQIWVVPNVIAIRAIAGFDPATHTLSFAALDDNALYGTRDQYYSIVNQIQALDRPGEFVVDETQQRIYLWPLAPLAGSAVTYGARADGFDTNGKSDVTLCGFHVRGTFSENAGHAIWNYRSWGDPSRRVVVRGNEISWIKTKDGRKGAIEFLGVNGLLIEDNIIHDCPRNSGMLLGSRNVTVQRNTVTRAGYKGLWFMGVENAQVLDNVFDQCTGTHGNPMSIFTTTNAVIARNRMNGKSGELLTYEGNHHFVVHANLLVSDVVNETETGSFVLRENGSAGTGYHVFTNNTILYSSSNFALGISNHPQDPTKQIVINNIADGGADLRANQVSHNLYTGLSWVQRGSEWQLAPGEQVVTDLDAIFYNPGAGDWRLSESSQARQAGINVTQALPVDLLQLFPEFDWYLDAAGHRQGLEAHWDLGALTLAGSATGEQVPGEGMLAYPNPASTVVTFAYRVNGLVSVRLDIFQADGTRAARIQEEKFGTVNPVTTVWQCAGFAPGIYFCRLVARDSAGHKQLEQTKKVAVVKN